MDGIPPELSGFCTPHTQFVSHAKSLGETGIENVVVVVTCRVILLCGLEPGSPPIRKVAVKKIKRIFSSELPEDVGPAEGNLLLLQIERQPDLFVLLPKQDQSKQRQQQGILVILNEVFKCLINYDSDIPIAVSDNKSERLVKIARVGRQFYDVPPVDISPNPPPNEKCLCSIKKNLRASDPVVQSYLHKPDSPIKVSSSEVHQPPEATVTAAATAIHITAEEDLRVLYNMREGRHQSEVAALRQQISDLKQRLMESQATLKEQQLPSSELSTLRLEVQQKLQHQSTLIEILKSDLDKEKSKNTKRPFMLDQSTSISPSEFSSMHPVKCISPSRGYSPMVTPPFPRSESVWNGQQREADVPKKTFATAETNTEEVYYPRNKHLDDNSSTEGDKPPESGIDVDDGAKAESSSPECVESSKKEFCDGVQSPDSRSSTTESLSLTPPRHVVAVADAATETELCKSNKEVRDVASLARPRQESKGTLTWHTTVGDVNTVQCQTDTGYKVDKGTLTTSTDFVLLYRKSDLQRQSDLDHKTDKYNRGVPSSLSTSLPPMLGDQRLSSVSSGSSGDVESMIDQCNNLLGKTRSLSVSTTRAAAAATSLPTRVDTSTYWYPLSDGTVAGFSRHGAEQLGFTTGQEVRFGNDLYIILGTRKGKLFGYREGKDSGAVPVHQFL